MPKSVFSFLASALVIAVSLSACTTPQNTNQLDANLGQTLFSNNCAACHGVDGSGASMMLRAQNIAFNTPEWQKKYTDKQMVEIIRNGKASMPNFDFTPEESQALVKYIRTLALEGQ